MMAGSGRFLINALLGRRVKDKFDDKDAPERQRSLDAVIESMKRHEVTCGKHIRTIFSASRRTTLWKISCRPPRKLPVQTATRSKRLWRLSVSGSS